MAPAPREANFAYLLGGLLCLLLAEPLLAEFLPGGTALLTNLVFAGMMLIGVWSLVDSRVWFWAGLSLAALSLACGVLRYRSGAEPLLVIGLAASLAFCVISAGFAGRHTFGGRRVTANRLAGAVCVYLLIGISFGIVNMLVSILLDGSFAGLPERAGVTQHEALLYYSFVTMSTLGYGDITPLRPLARALGWMGAVAGQFYIAILVGALVSMYLGSRRD